MSSILKFWFRRLNNKWQSMTDAEKIRYGMIAAGGILLLVILMAAQGCVQTKDKDAGNPFKMQKPYERVVLVGVDMSLSFVDHMTGDGKAYQFMLRLVGRYMRNGVDDRIILVQLSGNNRPILFEGTVGDIHKAWPNEAAFAKFLRAKSDPNSSRIHDGISDSLHYLLRYPGVSDKKVKSVVVLLTDMIDTSSKPGSYSRMEKLLEDYAKVGGNVGIYFCDEDLREGWTERLQRTGIRHHIVKSKESFNPELPDIE